VVFYIKASGPKRSQVATRHELLPDAETAEAMKRWWHAD
jgi:hypothetical protein